MGVARTTLPTSRTCTVCQSQFIPTTRYQAARNKTCSAECAKASMSAAKKGRPSPRDQRVMVPCAQCGTLARRRPLLLKRNTRVFCSHSCRATAHLATLLANAYDATGKPGVRRFGSDNPAWKGGVTYKRAKGNYVGPRYVRCPLDLLVMARSDGYVMEHRLVMARWVGRPLRRVECVNHIDRDPRNNARENLELYPTNGDHKRGEVGRFVPGVANSVFLPA